MMTKALEKERPVTENKKDQPEPETASQLPEPCGYKILIAIPDVEESTEGGIIKPDIVRELEEY